MLFSPPETLFDEITDFLSGAPTTAEIIAFQPSETLDRRLHDLLDKNSSGQLSADEQGELTEFLRMNHLLKMLKLKAQIRLAAEA